MAERFEILEKALVTMLEDKKYATLRDILVTMNPSDVAGLFSGLEEKQIPLLFRLLPKEQAAETFVEMEPDAQALLIRGFSDNELKEVVSEPMWSGGFLLRRTRKCAAPSTRSCATRKTPPGPL